MSSESIRQKIFAELNKRYKDIPLLGKFALSFYSYMPLDYNDDYDVDEFVSIAVRSFECFGHRVLGKHQIYTASEVTSEDGNEGNTFIWIVNDDMHIMSGNLSMHCF